MAKDKRSKAEKALDKAIAHVKAQDKHKSKDDLAIMKVVAETLGAKIPDKAEPSQTPKATHTFNLNIKTPIGEPTTSQANNLNGKNGVIQKFQDYTTNIGRKLAILIHSGNAPKGTKLLIDTKGVTAIFPDNTSSHMFHFKKGDYMLITQAGVDNEVKKSK